MITMPERNVAQRITSTSAPLRVLVVEDEFFIAKDIEHCLESAGYEVSAITSSGEMAIELAEELRPELVLMDIHLSGRIDGIAAATAIATSYGIPIVYLTAHSDPATLERAKAAGPFGYLVKPFNEQALYGAIETAIAKYRMDRQVLESEHWLSVVLSSIDAGLLVVDRMGRVLMVNPVAERLFGKTYSESVGQSVNELLRVEHEQTGEPLELLEYDASGAAGWRNTYVLRTLAGRTIPIDLKVSRLPAEAGIAESFLVQLEDVTERRAAERRIRHMALHDQLTGLSNRHLAFDRIEMLLARARRQQTKVGVVFLDLDDFKEVNDTLGHNQGDRFLCAVAERLRTGRRAVDTVARMGGDEFLLLVGDIEDRQDLAVAVESLLADLREPVELVGGVRVPSASVGLSLFPDDGSDPESLIQRADAAMYRAKHGGKDRYRFAGDERG